MKISQNTYNTPITLLMIDWNSSSVYSRVGNGTILMSEGMNCFQDRSSEEGLSDDFDEGSMVIFSMSVWVCWADRMINESKTC